MDPFEEESKSVDEGQVLASKEARNSMWVMVGKQKGHSAREGLTLGWCNVKCSFIDD